MSDGASSDLSMSDRAAGGDARSEPAGGASLSWGLALATYNRPDTVKRCLRHVLAQTRLPREIVVVDASAAWESSREAVAAMVAGTGVRLVYQQACIASASAQRNQAVRASTSDVLFLIDDDSFLYPDCAQRVMEIYEADRKGQIVGVQILGVTVPPPDPADEHFGSVPVAVTASSVARPGGTSFVKSLLRKALRVSDEREIFVPYDGVFHQRPLDWESDLPRPPPVNLMHGARMTFRRSVLLREPFSDVLRRHCPDDSDVSYRASRHGRLVNALGAMLCHVEAPGGRISRVVSSAFDAIGPLVLHRLHSNDVERSRRASRSMLRRRMISQALKDLAARRLSLPNARGVWLGLRAIKPVFRATTADDAVAWYLRYQDELLARFPATGSRNS